MLKSGFLIVIAVIALGAVEVRACEQPAFIADIPHEDALIEDYQADYQRYVFLHEKIFPCVMYRDESPSLSEEERGALTEELLLIEDRWRVFDDIEGDIYVEPHYGDLGSEGFYEIPDDEIIFFE